MERAGQEEDNQDEDDSVMVKEFNPHETERSDDDMVFAGGDVSVR